MEFAKRQTAGKREKLPLLYLMSFSEKIFAVTAVFPLRQFHEGLSKSSLSYPLGSKQLPNSYLHDKSLGQG